MNPFVRYGEYRAARAALTARCLALPTNSPIQSNIAVYRP